MDSGLQFSALESVPTRTGASHVGCSLVGSRCCAACSAASRRHWQHHSRCTLLWLWPAPCSRLPPGPATCAHSITQGRALGAVLMVVSVSALFKLRDAIATPARRSDRHRPAAPTAVGPAGHSTSEFKFGSEGAHSESSCQCPLPNLQISRVVWVGTQNMFTAARPSLSRIRLERSKPCRTTSISDTTPELEIVSQYHNPQS